MPFIKFIKNHMHCFPCNLVFWFSYAFSDMQQKTKRKKNYIYIYIFIYLYIYIYEDFFLILLKINKFVTHF